MSTNVGYRIYLSSHVQTISDGNGRNIWGEDAKPGYGLYDRALGAAYLSGVFEAVTKNLNK